MEYNIFYFFPPEQPLPAAAPTARTSRALPHGAISAAVGQRGSRASVLPMQHRGRPRRR